MLLIHGLGDDNVVAAHTTTKNNRTRRMTYAALTVDLPRRKRTRPLVSSGGVYNPGTTTKRGNQRCHDSQVR